MKYYTHALRERVAAFGDCDLFPSACRGCERPVKVLLPDKGVYCRIVAEVVCDVA